MAPHLIICVVLMFILTPGPSVSMCVLKVTQPQEQLQGRFNHSISILCHVNSSCPNKTPINILWYVFKTDSYYQLDINKQTMKYTLQDADLNINWLSPSDDGVYHCAASDIHSTNSGAQDIGTGTTLTVKENDFDTGEVVLITLVVLLTLYILIILTVFVLVKIGQDSQLKERQSLRKGGSNRRAHFGAVVQELYSKRNLRRLKKNTSTEVSQGNKGEKPQSHTESEDIYQNLKSVR